MESLNRRGFFAAAAASLAWARGLMASEAAAKSTRTIPGPTKPIAIHADGRFRAVAGEELWVGDYVCADQSGRAVRMIRNNVFRGVPWGVALESKFRGFCAVFVTASLDLTPVSCFV